MKKIWLGLILIATTLSFSVEAQQQRKVLTKSFNECVSSNIKGALAWGAVIDESSQNEIIECLRGLGSDYTEAGNAFDTGVINLQQGCQENVFSVISQDYQNTFASKDNSDGCYFYLPRGERGRSVFVSNFNKKYGHCTANYRCVNDTWILQGVNIEGYKTPDQMYCSPYLANINFDGKDFEIYTGTAKQGGVKISKFNRSGYEYRILSRCENPNSVDVQNQWVISADDSSKVNGCVDSNGIIYPESMPNFNEKSIKLPSGNLDVRSFISWSDRVPKVNSRGDLVNKSVLCNYEISPTAFRGLVNNPDFYNSVDNSISLSFNNFRSQGALRQEYYKSKNEADFHNGFNVGRATLRCVNNKWVVAESYCSNLPSSCLVEKVPRPNDGTNLAKRNPYGNLIIEKLIYEPSIGAESCLSNYESNYEGGNLPNEPRGETSNNNRGGLQ